MPRRLSYPLLLALAVGVAMQLAFAFAPDPGIGPGANGMGQLDSSFSTATSLFTHNLLTVAVIAIGELSHWLRHRS